MLPNALDEQLQYFWNSLSVEERQAIEEEGGISWERLDSPYQRLSVLSSYAQRTKERSNYAWQVKFAERERARRRELPEIQQKDVLGKTEPVINQQLPERENSNSDVIVRIGVPLHCVLGNGPDNIISQTQRKSGLYHQCILAYRAHQRSVLGWQFLNADVLKKSGCPLYQSRTIPSQLFGKFIPLIRAETCYLADGNELRVTK